MESMYYGLSLSISWFTDDTIAPVHFGKVPLQTDTSIVDREDRDNRRTTSNACRCTGNGKR